MHRHVLDSEERNDDRRLARWLPVLPVEAQCAPPLTERQGDCVHRCSATGRVGGPWDRLGRGGRSGAQRNGTDRLCFRLYIMDDLRERLLKLLPLSEEE